MYLDEQITTSATVQNLGVIQLKQIDLMRKSSLKKDEKPISFN